MNDNMINERRLSEEALAVQLKYIEKCKEYVKKLSSELGRPLKCCTQTFGCQMNV